MERTIADLLEKEYISGDELGTCIIKNDIFKFKGQEDKLISQDIMDCLMQKINTIEDAEKLECYIQLQMFIQRAQAMAYAFNQQAQNGCCRLLMYMAQSQQVEHARKLIENLPIIMTETQYNEMPIPGKLARQRGFALISNEFPCRPKCLTVEDYFIQPEIDCFQEMMSLENIEKMHDKIKYFREELMIPGIRKNLAYNELCRLIAKRTGIDDFTVFCVEDGSMTQQIKEMNEQRKAFDDEIAGEGEEYENKRRILNNVFKPIDTDSLHPSDKNISIVRQKLDNMDVFRTSPDVLIDILAEAEDRNGQ